MISRTKYDITREKIKEIFENAGIHGAHGIEPLTAGEYNAVFSVSAGGNDYDLKIDPLP